MKNKKTIIALIALICVVAVMAGIWFATRPRPEEVPTQTQKQTDPTTDTTGTTDPSADPTEPTFAKTFTVIVVHSDGTENTYTYGTNDDYLGPVLVEKGLAVESDSPGLYNTIDGETADWNVDQSYWSFYIGDEMAMYGMNDAVVLGDARCRFNLLANPRAKRDAEGTNGNAHHHCLGVACAEIKSRCGEVIVQRGRNNIRAISRKIASHLG